MMRVMRVIVVMSCANFISCRCLREAREKESYWRATVHGKLYGSGLLCIHGYCCIRSCFLLCIIVTRNLLETKYGYCCHDMLIDGVLKRSILKFMQ